MYIQNCAPSTFIVSNLGHTNGRCAPAGCPARVPGPFHCQPITCRLSTLRKMCIPSSMAIYKWQQINNKNKVKIENEIMNYVIMRSCQLYARSIINDDDNDDTSNKFWLAPCSSLRPGRMGHLCTLAGCTAWTEKSIARQALSDARPGRPGGRCRLAVSPKITPGHAGRTPTITLSIVHLLCACIIRAHF